MGDYHDRASGHLLMRHTDKAYKEHLRLVSFGASLERDARNLNFINSFKEGPWAGWMLLESKDQVKSPRLWTQSAPVTVPKDAPFERWQPMIEWERENKALKQAEGKMPLGLNYPGGYPGVLIPDVSLDEQINNASAAWAGLVCPSGAGDLKFASAVWAIDDKNNLIVPKEAPVSSAWYVYSRPKSALFGSASTFLASDNLRGLAWQTGLSGNGKDGTISGLGMCIEDNVKQAILFATGRSVGGLHHPGRFKDQHRISVNPDGIPINCSHTDTNEILQRADGTGDGPREDSGTWNNFETVAPLLTKCYWRFDPEAPHKWVLGNGKGLWKWQSTSFFGVVPKEKDKLKPGGGGGGVPPIPPLLPKGPVQDPSGTGSPPPLEAGKNFGPFVGPSSSKRVLYGTSRELSFISMVGRAQLFKENDLDLRNGRGPLSFEELDLWTAMPSVIRRDYGARTVAGNFDYTWNPGEGRYEAGGSADGFEAKMPAELGLEHSCLDSVALNALTLSEFYEITWRGRIGIGTPLCNPGAGLSFLKDGFSFGLNALEDTLTIGRHDSFGNLIENTSLDEDGDFETAGDVVTGKAFKDPSSFFFPPGSTTALRGHTVLVYTSLGAGTVNLPDPTSLDNLGSYVTVKDYDGQASTNNITVSTATGKIDGSVTGSSLTISENSRAVRLKADGTNWVVVSDTHASVFVSPDRLITISRNGDGADFDNIADAITAAGSLSPVPSAGNPCVIYMYPGSYSAAPFVLTAGLNLIGAGREAVQIEALDSDDCICEVQAYSSIESLSLHEAVDSNGVGLGFYDGSSALHLVRNVDVAYCYKAVETSGGTTATIEDSTFLNTELYSLYLGSSGDKVILTDVVYESDASFQHASSNIVGIGIDGPDIGLLMIAEEDSELSLEANDAGNKTLAISSSNSGAGRGDLDLSANGSTYSLNAGAVALSTAAQTIIEAINELQGLIPSGAGVQVLGFEEDVDLTTATGGSPVDMYTVPTGKKAIPTRALCLIKSVTSYSGDPSLSFSWSGGGDAFPIEVLSVVDTVDDLWEFMSAGKRHPGSASETLRYEVDTPSGSTVLTADLIVLGCLVDA